MNNRDERIIKLLNDVNDNNLHTYGYDRVLCEADFNEIITDIDNYQDYLFELIDEEVKKIKYNLIKNNLFRISSFRESAHRDDRKKLIIKFEIEIDPTYIVENESKAHRRDRKINGIIKK